VAVRGKNIINGDSVTNYHLLNEEFTGGMVFPHGITSVVMRNPQIHRKNGILLEIPAHRRGNHPRNEIPPSGK
jgi:hypothetical protein